MFGQLKQVVLDLTGFGPDILHVLLGAALFAAAYTLAKNTCLAFLSVAAIQSLNEALDIVDDVMVEAPVGLGDAISDCLLTLIIPAIVCVVVPVWSWLVKMNSRRSAP